MRPAYLQQSGLRIGRGSSVRPGIVSTKDSGTLGTSLRPHRPSMGTIPSMPFRKHNARLRHYNYQQLSRRKHRPVPQALSITHGIVSPTASPRDHHSVSYGRKRNNSHRVDTTTKSFGSTASSDHSTTQEDTHFISMTKLRRPSTASTPKSMQRFGGGFQARPKTVSASHRRRSKSQSSRYRRKRRPASVRIHPRSRPSEAVVPETAAMETNNILPRPPDVSSNSPYSPRTKTLEFKNPNLQQNPIARQGWSKPTRTPVFIRTAAHPQYNFGDARVFIPIQSTRQDNEAQYSVSPRGASMYPPVSIPTALDEISEIEKKYLSGAIVVPEPRPYQIESSDPKTGVKDGKSSYTIVHKNTQVVSAGDNISVVAQATVKSIVNSAFLRVLRNAA